MEKIGRSNKIEGRESLELRKKQYFSRFALRHKEELTLHRDYGVLIKSEGWRNVSEHCLLEAVEVDVLAEALKLSDENRKKVVTAALLHDFYKRKEVEDISGGTAEDFSTVTDIGNTILKERKYSDEIVRLVKLAGDVRYMPDEGTVDPEEMLCCKIIHYIDNITMNNQIVSADERLDKAESDSRYKQINELPFKGTTLIKYQRNLVHAIEQDISKRIGLDVSSDLPRVIEEKIWERIRNANKHDH